MYCISTPGWFAIQEIIYLFLYLFIFCILTAIFFVYQYKEETDFYTPLDCASNSGEAMRNGEGK